MTHDEISIERWFKRYLFFSPSQEDLIILTSVFLTITSEESDSEKYWMSIGNSHEMCINMSVLPFVGKHLYISFAAEKWSPYERKISISQRHTKDDAITSCGESLRVMVFTIAGEERVEKGKVAWQLCHLPCWAWKQSEWWNLFDCWTATRRRIIRIDSKSDVTSLFSWSGDIHGLLLLCTNWRVSRPIVESKECWWRVVADGN